MCWFLIGFIFPVTIIQSTVYKRLGKRSHLIRLKGNPLPAGSLTAPTPSVYLHNLHLLNFSRVSLGLQSQHQLVAQFHLSKQAKRMTCSFQKSSLILRNAYETEVNTPFTQMLEANSSVSTTNSNHYSVDMTDFFWSIWKLLPVKKNLTSIIKLAQPF